MTPKPVLSKKICDGIYCITLPLPGDKPGPVNVYLFIGRHNITLLDTGTVRNFKLLSHALAEHGLGWDNVDRIVLTHSHIDHYGAVKKILQASHTPIEVAGNFKKTTSVATGLGVSPQTMTDFLVLMDVPWLARSTMGMVSAFFSLLGDRCRVTAFIKEGDLLEMGDYQLRVYETPGHTTDSVCLHDEQTGRLFSGDHILPHITPNALVMLEEGNPLPSRLSQQEFYLSLKKIRHLSPTTVCPAHGRQIADFQKIHDMYVANFRERQGKILSLVREGDNTIYAMARQLFPIPNTIRLPLEIFLAVSEVYTHIQVLENKGRIRIDIIGNRLIAKRTEAI